MDHKNNVIEVHSESEDDSDSFALESSDSVVFSFLISIDFSAGCSEWLDDESLSDFTSEFLALEPTDVFRESGAEGFGELPFESVFDFLASDSPDDELSESFRALETECFDESLSDSVLDFLASDSPDESSELSSESFEGFALPSTSLTDEGFIFSSSSFPESSSSEVFLWCSVELSPFAPTFSSRLSSESFSFSFWSSFFSSTSASLFSSSLEISDLSSLPEDS